MFPFFFWNFFSKCDQALTFITLNNFRKEIENLKNIKTIVALGKVAFDACLKFYKNKYILGNNKFTFGHGAKYKLPDNKWLIGCYHPSPRNVNTKRININKMVRLFENAKRTI